jgi:hypothetical protein
MQPHPQEQSMSAKEPFFVHALSCTDRALLAEALTLLLRERSGAFRIASDVAMSKGREVPDVAEFGLSDILRLSRLLQM